MPTISPTPFDGMSIDEALDHLDAQGFFDDEDAPRAVLAQRKVLSRQFLRAFRDDDGVRQFYSMPAFGENGESVRRYKRVSNFTDTDYRVVVGEHAIAALYHRRAAERLAARAHQRFGVDISHHLDA